MLDNLHTHDFSENSSSQWLRRTENRLTSVETLPGLPMDVPVVHVSFTYDYMSRRIGKTVYEWDDATTNWFETFTSSFIYDGWNLLSETINNQTSTITNRFTWGLDLSGSLQGAGGIGGLLASYTSDSSNPVRLYTYDANGNVSEVLDGGAGTPSSRILAHYEYSPFGETITATGPLAKENPYRFSTKYTDDETKLVYYGYRFYSPDLGRWVSRDPIGEWGGLNVYGFVINRPIALFDYLGLLSLYFESNVCQGCDPYYASSRDSANTCFHNPQGIYVSGGGGSFSQKCWQTKLHGMSSRQLCDTETHIFIRATNKTCCKEWFVACVWQFNAEAQGPDSAHITVRPKFFDVDFVSPPILGASTRGSGPHIAVASRAGFEAKIESFERCQQKSVFKLQPKIVVTGGYGSIITESGMVSCTSRCLDSNVTFVNLGCD